MNFEYSLNLLSIIFRFNEDFLSSEGKFLSRRHFLSSYSQTIAMKNTPNSINLLLCTLEAELAISLFFCAFKGIDHSQGQQE